MKIRATSSHCWLSRRPSWCVRSVRWYSAASATWWDGSIPDRVKTGLGGNAGEPSRQTCPHEILAGQAGDFAEIVGATSWLSVITPVDLQKPARRRLSGRNRGHRLFKPNNIQHPPEIVGERGQAELGPDLLQTTQQKRPLVHQLLDRAKRVFDRLASTVEDIGTLCQARLHPVQHRFVLQTRDCAELAPRALRTDLAVVARQFVDVVDLLQAAQKR